MLLAVVGLPGEGVEIRDGAVYLNGERMTPPPEFAWLQYESEFEPAATPHFIPPNSPQQLSDDEHGILGDYPALAYDYRYYGPVPRRSLRGVVTARYRSPPRWMIWR